MTEKSEVLILGAGIQGCCTALALAGRGQNVILLEQDERAMNRASLRNEGKVHLGLVYANDPSMKTALLQLQGALTFWPLLAGWLDCQPADLARSTPFTYLVADDSLLSPEQLGHHYDKLERHYRELLANNPGWNYLGELPQQLASRQPRDQWNRFFGASRIQAAFATAERSVTTEVLAERIRKAIQTHPRVSFRPQHRVDTIERSGAEFRVYGQRHQEQWTLGAAQVVNATWHDRLRLDRQLGLDRQTCLYRLKYRVIADLPPQLRGGPSATMVLGAYGDVVIRPDDTVYLSWYPDAMRGWSQQESPPADWSEACTGSVPETQAREIAQRVCRAVDQWMPGMNAARPLSVDAGVIVAVGDTDVDDPASKLHQRSEVGIQSVSGYHSLDAGKLTTAPMFAALAAERVLNA